VTEIKILAVQLLGAIAGLGPFASLAYIPIYIIGTMLFVPTFILTLAAGALFGIPMGFAVALTSSLAAASAGFLAGRYLSRGWILNKVTSHIKYEALDNAVAENSCRIVLLLRLSAIMPFTFLNYGLGLTKIHFKNYVLASSIGMIPGTLLYVYLGSLAGDMLFKRNDIQITSVELVFGIFGFAMTIGMTVYAAMIVKKALRAEKNSVLKRTGSATLST